MRTERPCIVFDIDDTLYLESEYVASGFEAVGREVLARFGAGGFVERARHHAATGPRGQVIDRAVADLGIAASTAQVQHLVDVYRRHEPRIRLLEDARRALDCAAGTGCVAVVSDGPLVSQAAKARALGLRRWTELVVLTGERCPGEPKPSSRAFQIVMTETDAAAAACTYVADNPAKDFAGPTALGWRTVRVRRARGLHAAVDSGPDVDVEVPDLSDVRSWLPAR